MIWVVGSGWFWLVLVGSGWFWLVLDDFLSSCNHVLYNSTQTALQHNLATA